MREEPERTKSGGGGRYRVVQIEPKETLVKEKRKRDKIKNLYGDDDNAVMIFYLMVFCTWAFAPGVLIWVAPDPMEWAVAIICWLAPVTLFFGGIGIVGGLIAFQGFKVEYRRWQNSRLFKKGGETNE